MLIDYTISRQHQYLNTLQESMLCTQWISEALKLCLVNPLVPEFKISAKPINNRNKMAAHRQKPMLFRIMLYSLSLQSKLLQ